MKHPQIGIKYPYQMICCSDWDVIHQFLSKQLFSTSEGGGSDTIIWNLLGSGGLILRAKGLES